MLADVTYTAKFTSSLELSCDQFEESGRLKGTGERERGRESDRLKRRAPATASRSKSVSCPHRDYLFIHDAVVCQTVGYVNCLWVFSFVNSLIDRPNRFQHYSFLFV